MSRTRVKLSTKQPISYESSDPDEPSIPVKKATKSGGKKARYPETASLPIDIPKLRRERAKNPNMRPLDELKTTPTKKTKVKGPPIITPKLVKKKTVIGSDNESDGEVEAGVTGSPLVRKVAPKVKSKSSKSSKSSRSSVTTRKPNAWMTHLSSFRKKHPDLSYKECMTQAKQSY